MDSCDEQKQKFCQALMDHVGTPGQFPAHIRCRLVSLTPAGEAVGELEAAPENLNVWGIVHGGALAALADTVAGSGVAAATGHGCVTVNYSMNFLRPAAGSKITCTARPEKLGRRICVMRAELTDDAGETVSVSDLTFCLTKPLKLEAP